MQKADDTESAMEMLKGCEQLKMEV
jgi:hypothetical protein